MTEQGQLAAEIWRERDFARSWAQGDGLRDMLDYPRRIAAAIVGQDNASPACVVDIASGPGDFLAVFLSAFPSARGIWTDASEAMLELATERLAPFGDRVTFQVANMTELAGAGIPAGVDVITTSRASHHLDRPALQDFYTQAAGYLAPGGWLVDLDHTGPGEAWDARLRSARQQLHPTRPGGRTHQHAHPLTSVQDHLDGYAAAGIGDAEVVWRAFVTCLFMGRRAVESPSG
jgi:SAM-dependent methyltransferase